MNEYDIWKINKYLNIILINIFIFILEDEMIKVDNEPSHERARSMARLSSARLV
jgi:hypothetical protein